MTVGFSADHISHAKHQGFVLELQGVNYYLIAMPVLK